MRINNNGRQTTHKHLQKSVKINTFIKYLCTVLFTGTTYLFILFLISVAIFIITMDVLKYVFKIDPVEIDRNYLLRKRNRQKRKRKKSVVALRFTYVHKNDQNQ